MLIQLVNEITLSDVLYFSGIVIIVVALLQKNSNFLDVRKIIRQHMAVFAKSPLQITAIFIAPLLLAVGALQTHPLNADIVNNLNVVLSILISMFFAMLGILASLNKKSTDNEKIKDITFVKSAEKFNKLLVQTQNAVLFESLVSILLLVITFSQLFVGNYEITWKLKLVSGVVYYLALVLVLNVFVVIKRVKELLDTKSESDA